MINKLNINLENCYGIKRLTKEFDFTDCNLFTIYSPNGLMKTSFSKTFLDISKGNNPSDKIHNNPCSFQIKLDGTEITAKDIYVIESFVSNFNSENFSSLLVDKESKIEYDSIYSIILKKKLSLISQLNRLSGVKKDDLESTLLKDFDSKDFYELLNKIIIEEFEQDFSNISYSQIIEKDVLEFIKSNDITTQIIKYITKYNELIDKSKYYKRGIFNPTKADTVAATLKKENFFNAEHAIKLKGDDEVLTSFDEFEHKLKEERKEILENRELKKIEDLIKKASVLKFRELLENNPEILLELTDLNLFKQKLWISYLKVNSEDAKEVWNEYNEGQAKLKEIEARAVEQLSTWDEVVQIFDTRFSVPYKVAIEDRSSAILGKSTPYLIFKFYNSETGQYKVLKRNELEDSSTLSQGEKRALYILNIIFEIEVRRRNDERTLLIVDDIADSFDYKNKYAIVQYLSEISQIPRFYLIILTHNFDFYRTLNSRLKVSQHRSNKLHAYRGLNNEIYFQEELYQNNPFLTWKKHLNIPANLIASIPFVRNVIEFTDKASPNYIKLTALLHWIDKPDLKTKDFLLTDLKIIFESILSGITFQEPAPDAKVAELIFATAQNCHAIADHLNLENKIVLSIAIRLEAERYMINEIKDPVFLNTIKKNQTIALLLKYKELFHDRQEQLKILEDVNLMTPENIHINSFMYEPILDMSDQHLKQLHLNVIALQPVEI